MECFAFQSQVIHVAAQKVFDYLFSYRYELELNSKPLNYSVSLMEKYVVKFVANFQQQFSPSEMFFFQRFAQL